MTDMMSVMRAADSRRLVSSSPATDVALQGPMGRASPFWHQLERL